MGIIIALIIGGLAGWLASLIVGQGSKLGLIGNIVVGIVGAFLVNLLGVGVDLANPSFGGFVLTVLGSAVLLLVINAIASRR